MSIFRLFQTKHHTTGGKSRLSRRRKEMEKSILNVYNCMFSVFLLTGMKIHGLSDRPQNEEWVKRFCEESTNVEYNEAVP